jgi:hypothetical protein
LRHRARLLELGAGSRGIEALGYDASADRQSWAALLGLLDEVTG